MLEIKSLKALDKWLKAEAKPPAAVQALDLCGYVDALKGKDFCGSIFLSCTMCKDATFTIVQNHGIVVPDSHKLSFPSHRGNLYSVERLFNGYEGGLIDDYKTCYDYRVYEEFIKDGKLDTPLDVGFFRYLHDHSITDALYGLIRGRKVVGVMGGHGMERADPYYTKIARLSRQLTQDGYLMISGGGPGAMEATHLGAYFSTLEESDMLDAIAAMSNRPADAKPGKEYADEDWLQRAWGIRERYPLSDEAAEKSTSIGIPTWFYGHEPPAPFPTHIAKYFSNSIREDGLLMIATHGVIFAPGSAGTRQEIFQDAAQNHYGTAGQYSPMIMMGKDYWTGQSEHEYSYPVWQLLKETASKDYKALLAITDDEAEVVKLIKAYNPAEHRAKTP
jgi:predicted Rossmann-fold nucleotide-binding protein